MIHQLHSFQSFEKMLDWMRWVASRTSPETRFTSKSGAIARGCTARLRGTKFPRALHEPRKARYPESLTDPQANNDKVASANTFKSRSTYQKYNESSWSARSFPPKEEISQRAHHRQSSSLKGRKKIHQQRYLDICTFSCSVVNF